MEKVKEQLNELVSNLNHRLSAWRWPADIHRWFNEKVPDNALRVVLPAASFGTLILIYMQFLAPAFFEGMARLIPARQHTNTVTDSVWLAQFERDIGMEKARLERRIDRMVPPGPYLVINSTKNEFELYRGGQLTRKGICSTGSYVRLEQDDERQWVFKTPKGMFRIQGKTRNPVWKKPDWAFVEEGKAVPAINHPSRFEYGVLGDYSLSLGDGYLIHGTLYQRMLGLPVTHGCVRLGDADLEAIFRTLNQGDRVFIY